ncbi:MAG: restriction endonuclease subunit S [Mesorhizobium sp.]|uniref:restriction endonuclease subunit S n=1 Tax=Mesorhizobium sp. TaxID=1871066 RepID=UPI000FE98569|nr:restriction endonuclease subunit S [Mesorhizobium sp.]RWB91329.1 MAG: restriction endonuclease subunit S [Mesorhizobium sp.]
MIEHIGGGDDQALYDLPPRWSLDRLKFHLERNDGGVWGHDPDGESDTIVLRSTEQTVDGRWVIEDPALRKLGSTEREAALLDKGDLLVTKSSGSSLHIGKTTLVDDEVAKLSCCYSNFMQRLRTKPTLSPRLAWYLLNHRIVREQFDLMSNSTTGLANLSAGVIGQAVVPIPPPSEQIAITSFLDRETVKIDALVEEQKRLIELLKEKRQAVISHVVSKGRDPGAKMKDSGIEWLGQVPEHWEIKKFSRCVKIAEGQVDPELEPFRSMTLIAPNHIESGTGRLVGLETAADQGAESGKYLCRAGDVIYSKIRPALAKVTVTPVDALCSADMYPMSSVELDHRYLCFVLLSPQFTAWSVLEADRVAMPKINRESLSDLRLPVPPMAEQEQIATSLDRETTRFDELLFEAEASVRLLQERRVSLISAAVTGKIDVGSAVMTETVAA